VHKRERYCEIYKSIKDKVAGTCKENGSGSNAEKGDRRKTSLEMDDVADLKVMKIKQWMEKTKDSDGEWLLRRPRLTQDCSAERMDGRVP
jgi:hypothetical protein